MNKKEAIALFERVYKTLAELPHFCIIQLIYQQEATIKGARIWHITVDSWGIHWKIENEQDWQSYKHAHAICETSEAPGDE